MEETIKGFINDLPWDTTPALAWTVLLGMIAVNLAVLAKAADWLVEEAVVLSERSGLSRVVIGRHCGEFGDNDARSGSVCFRSDQWGARTRSGECGGVGDL